jgi:transglutaminase-like putative cysteine protease
MRNTLLALVPTCLCTSLAFAQAPVITPAGDPSVSSDTIYRLAVNPADHPDEGAVYLLDDGVVRVEADGRGTRTYRQVVQVLKQEAAAQVGEQVISYLRSREKLTINWIRLLRPDGTVVSDTAAHEQESDAPAALAYPVYSDMRLHRVTIGGVAPGLIVDRSYTIETLDPVMPGDFLTSWRFTVGQTERRSRFILDVPASVRPRIVEHNLGFAPQVSEARGRRVYVWARQDVPKRPDPEPFAADSNDFNAFVAVASPESWDDVARWYAGLARGRYTLTPALDSALSANVGPQRSAADSLRALYRWIAQDFRYVSISLGLAGYQPREPSAVLDSRFGDCKDKATIFVALAQRLGLHAYPVLLSSFGHIDTSLVSLRQFNHMIAAVEQPSGYLYLDLTAETVPVGQLPPPEAGGFALVVHPDGREERVTLPLDSVTAGANRLVLEGEIAPDGSFSGRATQTYEGIPALINRAAYGRDIPAARREQMLRSWAGSTFEGAEGDSLELFDGRDLTAPARVAFVIRHGKATTRAGTNEILTLPLRPVVPSSVVSEVAAHVPRRFHIAAQQVFRSEENVLDLRFTLPEGWHALLPAGVSASSEFGSYSSTYAQQGRELRVVRRVVGARGVYPPDKVEDLLAFLRAVARDDARYIVIQHS